MYDTQELKARTNLLDLVGRHTTLKKLAANVTGHGAEYGGRCWMCNSGHRVHVQPDAQGGGRFFCRQCHPDWGDAIEFCKWAYGDTFEQACERLGAVENANTPGPAHHGAAAPAPSTLAIRPTETPPPTWQERARAFVTWAQGQLWQTPAALDYLHGRGLTDDTIRAAGLGWNGRDWSRRPTSAMRREAWGLEPDDEHPCVYVPIGLVIPCELGGVLQYVKVRRPNGTPGDKYIAITGSKKAGVLYCAPGPVLPDMILTEGELNALSLYQVLGPLCSYGSLGDANNLPGGASMGVLLQVARVWTRYDPDKAGSEGRDKLGEMSARVRCLTWPWEDCKDPNDALLAGHDLAEWAVPQVGPRDPTAREAWAHDLLWQIEDAAFAQGGDDTTPISRLWCALSEAYIGVMGRKCPYKDGDELTEIPF